MAKYSYEEVQKMLRYQEKYGTKANMYCPFCGAEGLRFLDDCEASKGERKTSWTCDCEESNGAIVYIYEFPNRKRKGGKS